MQKDFHYYATAVLARAAGFGEEDALTIGYAAQYVDDALDGRTIRVGGEIYEPQFTANDFGRYIRYGDSDTWNKVYIPFHFLPSLPNSSGPYAFLTLPGSHFAQELLSWSASRALGTGKRRLCQLGVALHTVADTWAHQGFSGRLHAENDVVDLTNLETPTSFWDAIKLAIKEWMNVFYVVAPPSLCHCQVGFLADLPAADWMADLAAPLHPGEQVRRQVRHNATEFLNAGRFIYDKLKLMPKDAGTAPLAWSEIQNGIRSCLEQDETDADQRCPAWQQTFGDLFRTAEGGFRTYNPDAWEAEALGSPLLESPFSELAEDKDNPPEYRGVAGWRDSRWCHFHTAAAAQRAWVQERLPA